ncbi:anaerobic ribonucleoside-triphosphate reductase activating protein [Fusobacterium sp. PH5-44]|uniref:anaerobic ribonucleoside-triphosphate reductase activating protein n=1 Tax=unclassified Fusobacterium TaxID=2648384 RepID=UPI003D24ADD2
MKYSGIKYSDMINGEGIRVSLFVSGCDHSCKGCFNRVAWDSDYGDEFNEETKNKVFDYIRQYDVIIKGISLLGGDPTYYSNVEPLIELLEEFKKEFPTKDVWIWSGYTWEQIEADSKKMKLISLCDVLIDGKFDSDLKDLNQKWRGSTNQRVINIRESLKSGEIIDYIV